MFISIFKNISYPLFWADESMTVMEGARVLEFGYPKVHDGKNVLYDLNYPDASLGVDPETDAYIGGAGWGQYYIAAIGVKLAEMTDDIYLKTGLIRAVFAFFGLSGLALLSLLGTYFFQTRSSKTAFLAVFILLEVMSVPLALHLREARYYPLAVFLISLFILSFARYRILRQARYATYFVLSISALLFLFLTFSPAYFALLCAIFLFESVYLVYAFTRNTGKVRAGDGTLGGKNLLEELLRNVLPCLVSLAAAVPLMFYFNVLKISEKLSQYYATGFKTDAMGMYLDNLRFIWTFFASSDLIYAAIFFKAALLAATGFNFFARRRAYNFDSQKIIFSLFLSIVFTVYFFAIPRLPNPVFTRYFIQLQPILTLIVIVDATLIFGAVSSGRSSLEKYLRKSVVVVLMVFAAFHISNNLPFLKGHVYELFNRYKGPLDYVIPYIQEKYEKTDGLVIATNYEETSFMYYLDARVTIGFVGNNLVGDITVQPDIILYRKDWYNFKDIFSDYIRNVPYDEISFPVVDYAVNNIPELHRDFPHHRFRTQESEDEWMKTYIHLRK